MKNKFAERLKELRLERKISTKELSDFIGCSNVAISRWENGLRLPSIYYIEKLALFFNVSTDYLIGLKDYE